MHKKEVQSKFLIKLNILNKNLQKYYDKNQMKNEC